MLTDGNAEETLFFFSRRTASQNVDDGDNRNDQDAAWSSLSSAIFNFTNCIVGAGAIGLGGAIAESGGLVSVVTVAATAVLVKISLDLIIRLSMEHCSHHHSDAAAAAPTYEDLGYTAAGRIGKFTVMASKFLYSFGCLVAYTVVMKDNFGPALRNLLYGGGSHQQHQQLTDDHDSTSSSSWLYWFLGQDVWTTWFISAVIVLPLCLLRDMTPLAKFSILSIVSMLTIVALTVFLWWQGVGDDNDDAGGHETTDARLDYEFIMREESEESTTANHAAMLFYQHWLQIRWGGFLANMGTFVFTFVCQHMAHLTYGSLRPDERNLQSWKKVSTASLTAAATISLSIGLAVYMTFWERTESDIFQIYPASPVLDLAKLLLCVTMLLTFPLPFLTCRELVIVFWLPYADQINTANQSEGNHAALQASHSVVTNDLQEPLLSLEQGREMPDSSIVEDDTAEAENPSFLDASLARSESHASVMTELSVLSSRAIEVVHSALLLPGEDRQLKLPYHIILTCKLWFVITGFAVAAPSLGDVLDLVGCATGTLIAFILPGSFALRLEGYSHIATLILIVGGIVGTVGTVCSLKQFLADTFG
jgi:amino acid permease